MVGLVKIGKTNQSDVVERMKQLYGSGVPFPFDCVFACQVKDATQVEKALHIAFGNVRANPNREFFRIEADRVIAILKLLEVKDITIEFEQQIEDNLDDVDKQSSQNIKNSKRPRMNFHELDIPDGSILISKDGQVQIKVIGAKKVNFDGEECSLAEATRKLLKLQDNYPIQGSPHWTFNGKTVKEIYDEFYSETDDGI